MNISYFQISNEIKKALKDNQPIVALESTLISHGLPYPENLTNSFLLGTLPCFLINFL